MRVVVTDVVRMDTLDTSWLRGKIGTVVRLRMCDDGAWINMDQDIPDELRSFPADDASRRGNHVLLYPDECEELKEAAVPPKSSKVKTAAEMAYDAKYDTSCVGAFARARP